jgi:uncharacterized protein YceK
MQWKRRIAVVFLTVLLATSSGVVRAEYVGTSAAHESRDGFNDEYVFATTRGVNDMDVPAALKVTLFPVTIVLDTAFLPFAVIAGFVA